MSAVHLLGITLVVLGDAVVLDRIAAVVGDEPIFLSDVRRREAPYLVRVEAAKGGDAERAKVERETVDRMIDEKLEAREAQKLHLTVAPSEVDKAVAAVAEQLKLSVPALLAEAKRQGMPETEYRDEIRRQILEGKLLQLRVRGRVQVTDADTRAVYDAWVKEQPKDAPAPPFDRVKDEMKARAYTTAMDRERKAWIGELRSHTYIEVKP